MLQEGLSHPEGLAKRKLGFFRTNLWKVQSFGLPSIVEVLFGLTQLQEDKINVCSVFTIENRTSYFEGVFLVFTKIAESFSDIAIYRSPI